MFYLFPAATGGGPVACNNIVTNITNVGAYNVRGTILLHSSSARQLIGSSDLHKLLNPVSDASHNRRGPVAKCYPGTRETVISEIKRCVEAGEPICWLSGPAGSGKSAISHAIAELYTAKGRLAADFFFFRGAGNRSKIAGLIPTLAYQLSVSRPATKSLVLKQLENDPDIFHKSHKHQLMKLIIEPIRATTKSPLSFLLRAKPLVIVIDGLDECDDKPAMAELVTAIVDTLLGDPQLPLRIFMTSRVEEHIREKLEIQQARSVSRHLALEK